jgi:hypothetical protein
MPSGNVISIRPWEEDIAGAAGVSVLTLRFALSFFASILTGYAFRYVPTVKGIGSAPSIPPEDRLTHKNILNRLSFSFHYYIVYVPVLLQGSMFRKLGRFAEKAQAPSYMTMILCKMRFHMRLTVFSKNFPVDHGV